MVALEVVFLIYFQLKDEENICLSLVKLSFLWVSLQLGIQRPIFFLKKKLNLSLLNKINSRVCPKQLIIFWPLRNLWKLLSYRNLLIAVVVIFYLSPSGFKYLLQTTSQNIPSDNFTLSLYIPHTFPNQYFDPNQIYSSSRESTPKPPESRPIALATLVRSRSPLYRRERFSTRELPEKASRG